MHARVGPRLGRSTSGSTAAASTTGDEPVTSAHRAAPPALAARRRGHRHRAARRRRHVAPARDVLTSRPAHGASVDAAPSATAPGRRRPPGRACRARAPALDLPAVDALPGRRPALASGIEPSPRRHRARRLGHGRVHRASTGCLGPRAAGGRRPPRTSRSSSAAVCAWRSTPVETIRSFDAGLDAADRRPPASRWPSPATARRTSTSATAGSPTAGYAGHLAPFDAVWGQRYAVVHDPDGNPVDLFAASRATEDGLSRTERPSGVQGVELGVGDDSSSASSRRCARIDCTTRSALAARVPQCDRYENCHHHSASSTRPASKCRRPCERSTRRRRGRRRANRARPRRRRAGRRRRRTRRARRSTLDSAPCSGSTSGSGPESGSNRSLGTTSAMAPSRAPATSTWVTASSTIGSATSGLVPVATSWSPRGRRARRSAMSAASRVSSPRSFSTASRAWAAAVRQTSSSLLPSNARPRVTSSAYSRSPPTGRPLASRVTRSPIGLSSRAR